MKTRTAALIGSLGTLVVLVAGTIVYARVTGLRASGQPSSVEEAVARGVRRFAVPSTEARRANPVAASEGVLAEGLAHYADHCASCHAIDGSGSTDMGRGFFPKAPDMRAAATQGMTDGELFYAARANAPWGRPPFDQVLRGIDGAVEHKRPARGEA